MPKAHRGAKPSTRITPHHAQQTTPTPKGAMDSSLILLLIFCLVAILFGDELKGCCTLKAFGCLALIGAGVVIFWTIELVLTLLF